MRLTTILNGPKRTIFASGRLRLLQIVSELGTERCDPTSIREGNECQRGRWVSKGGGLWDPTSVGEGNEAFFIRVCKPLPSKRVLKPWGWWRYITRQSSLYLLAVGLDCYTKTLILFVVVPYCIRGTLCFNYYSGSFF